MLYDLTHPIAEGMTVFPGDPQPRLRPLSQDPPWHTTEIYMGTHTGTHIDAPSHIGHRTTINSIGIDRLVGRGVVVDAAGKDAGQSIGVDDIGAALPYLQQGLWAIVRTGWSRYWNTSGYLHHPYLDATLAHQLVNWGVPLVGVDLLNPDDTQAGSSSIHQILLGAGVVIVENLTGLEALAPNRPFMFAMLPLKLTGCDGSPIRAVAWDIEPE